MFSASLIACMFVCLLLLIAIGPESFSYTGNSPVVDGNTVSFDLLLGRRVESAKCGLLIGNRIQNEIDCKFDLLELNFC